MKRLTFKITCLLLAISISTAYATIIEQDFDKIIEKEFPISADGEVDLKNRYGSINISEWDKNAVSIVVSITVETSSQSKADKIFDRIDVNFKNDPGYVMAHTEIEDSNSSWFSSWNSDSDFQINYEVKMPKSVKLKLVNKYGSTYLPNLTNNVDLTIGYGKLRMGNVDGKTTISLSYSQADFKQLNDVNASMKYSEFQGESMKELNIESKYSEVASDNVSNVKSTSSYDTYVIGKVQNFDNIGKYDEFRIGEAENIEIDNKYSDIHVDHLHGDLKVSQKFGSIAVDKIDCSEGEIKINTEYTDVKLDMDGCSDYDINVQGSYTDHDLPSNLRSALNRDGKRTSLEAQSGNKSRRLKIDMKYGSLKL